MKFSKKAAGSALLAILVMSFVYQFTQHESSGVESIQGRKAEPQREAPVATTTDTATQVPKSVPAQQDGEATAHIKPTDMDREERLAEINELEELVDSEEVISRLNQGTVTAADRERYGKVLDRIMQLKIANLSETHGDIKSELEEIEAGHEEKVARMKEYLATLKK